MRIRQIRPEFWTDALVAAMPATVRLFYVGLWCVADDYGWFRWEEAEIAALLFPYAAPKRRLADVQTWGETLQDTGRLVIYQCGCACIPTLPRHQVNGGRKSGTSRDRHLASHSSDRVRIVPEIPAVGNVRVSNVRGSGTVPDTATFKEKLAAAGGKVP